MSNYDVGDGVRLTAVFKDVAGVEADPTTVTLKVKTPAKAISSCVPVKDSAGNYHYDLVLDAPGTWWYRWVGVGAVTAAQEDRLTVNKSQFV